MAPVETLGKIVVIGENKILSWAKRIQTSVLKDTLCAHQKSVYSTIIMVLFFCLQLTSAPKVLPSSLVSADFAANQLTRIYPYTFGHKPKLRYKCASA